MNSRPRKGRWSVRRAGEEKTAARPAQGACVKRGSGVTREATGHGGEGQVRRHVKASSAGRLSVFVLAVVLLTLAAVSSAWASKGFVGYFATEGYGADELSSPRNIAINNTGSGA